MPPPMLMLAPAVALALAEAEAEADAFATATACAVALTAALEKPLESEELGLLEELEPLLEGELLLEDEPDELLFDEPPPPPPLLPDTLGMICNPFTHWLLIRPSPIRIVVASNWITSWRKNICKDYGAMWRITEKS